MPEQNSSDAHISTLLETVDCGLAIIDAQGMPVFANQRFFNMLERSGLLVGEYAGLAREQLDDVSLNVSAPELKAQPLEVKGPGGREFELSYRSDPSAPEATFVQMRDVTAHAIDADAVDSARAQAEMIASARSAFVSQVAHHFRTPLHVILGYVDLLSEATEMAMTPQDRGMYLQYIRESASALLLNMNEMMEVIRLQSEDVDAELELSDIGALLQSVSEETAEAFELQGCKLDAEGRFADRPVA